MDHRTWMLMNEIRDVAEFKGVDAAIKNASRHFHIPARVLRKQFDEAFPGYAEMLAEESD
jgi:hypothetical protein